jgi:hypothetical protein
MIGDVDARPVIVASADVARFHRPDCPLVRGRNTEAADPSEQVALGRVPCGACRP